MEMRITVPEGIDFSVEGKTIYIKGPKGNHPPLSFNLPWLEIKAEGRDIVVTSRLERRKQKAMFGTIRALLKNAFKGVKEGWSQRLKIVYAHFPISVKVEPERRRVLIQNFLGEKAPRVAEIVGESTRVRVEGDEVIVEGIDKYEVGQTAWNIERATRIKRRDPRVFQDGIYRL
jgi:large subunit ribosomal protein L6